MQVIFCRMENSFTNMFPTIMGRLRRMDCSHVMGGDFGGLRPVGQPRSRREDAIWRDDVDLFQIRDWKMAAGRENVGVRSSERSRPQGGPDHQMNKKKSFFPSLTIILFVKFRLSNLVVLFFKQGISVVLEYAINTLNPELNLICYLLALLGAHHFLHVRRIRVKILTVRRLMSYIYGAPILDVSRSHTTTQHSR